MTTRLFRYHNQYMTEMFILVPDGYSAPAALYVDKPGAFSGDEPQRDLFAGATEMAFAHAQGMPEEPNMYPPGDMQKFFECGHCRDTVSLDIESHPAMADATELTMLVWKTEEPR